MYFNTSVENLFSEKYAPEEILCNFIFILFNIFEFEFPKKGR